MHIQKNIFHTTVIALALHSLMLTALRSQNSTEVFKILGAKNVFVLDAAAQRPARSGIALRAETLLRIDAGGYVALIHHTGKSLELREAGTYKSTDLEQRLIQKQTTSTQKVATFVLHAIAQKNKSSTHQENMNTLGAVARMSTGDDKEVTVLVPRLGNVIDSAISLQWYGNSTESNQSGTGLVLPSTLPQNSPPSRQSKSTNVYKVELKNERGTILHTLETTDSSFVFKPSPLGIQRGDLIRWTVHLIGSKVGQEYSFRWLNQEEANTLTDTLSTIRAELTDSASPLSHFLIGMLFERYQCYTEALYSYKTAIQNAPNVYDYSEALNILMVKLGLNEDDITRLTFPVSR
jgi:hypothetical protein